MHRWGLTLCLLGLAAWRPAAAHHSLSHYDGSQQVAMDGAVTEFRYANPHPFLVIEVPTPGAGPQPWRLEMDNLWELEQLGFTRDTFKPGDLVSVRGSPNRDQSRSMYLRRLDRAKDGMRYEQVGSTPMVTYRGK